ncbi:MAG: class I SAM-dependent methyltransferase [Candidatus Helarchaeota archaeon]
MIKKDVKETFEIIADRFDKVRKLPWPDLLDFIDETGFIDKDDLGLILDLGCGNGRHGRYILEKRPNDRSINIVGVDIAFNFLKLARKYGKDINYINADANYLPFKQKIFNRILSIAILHHIPNYNNRKDSLLELKRVLANNGLVLISVWRLWQKRFYKYFLKEVKIKKFLEWNGEFGDIFVPWHNQDKKVIANRFYHLFSIDEFNKIIRETGFVIKKSKIAGTTREKGTIFAVLKIMDTCI